MCAYRNAMFAVFVSAISSAQALAQTEGIDRFELFNECRPIRLVVEDLSDDAADIELTEERIQTLAESRLRAARLYDDSALHRLYVRVGVLVSEKNRDGGTFTVSVQYAKVLYDSVSGEVGLADTWHTGSYGTHSGDAGYIMQSLSEHLDRFVLEYLRTNESACAS